MFYTVKAPWILKKLYPSLVWEKPADKKVIYLTFDDGPHETATDFVLGQLQAYGARATFFCIGKNVAEYGAIYRRIIEQGHKAGNHTYNHLNGWKTGNSKYISNIFEAAKYIDSNLFRPPYGRITNFQVKLLQGLAGEKTIDNSYPGSNTFKIIMWSVLSGDFDPALSPQNCLQNVVLHTKPGSIIVFHDSAKAWDRMSFALPKVLRYFTDEGYVFEALD